MICKQSKKDSSSFKLYQFTKIIIDIVFRYSQKLLGLNMTKNVEYNLGVDYFNFLQFESIFFIMNIFIHIEIRF